MQNLPPGWRVSNSKGSWSAPANGHVFDDDVLEDNEELRPDSPGWEDMEDDTEAASIKCLLCDKQSGSPQAMLDHCKTLHDFDFDQVRRQHNLDFYATIKLVNYIRSQVQDGTTRPDTNDPSAWADDKFMKPAMEDDALLFNLDELLSADEMAAEGGQVREYPDQATEGAGQKALVERALKQ